MHGSSTRLSREAARRRLAELLEPALVALRTALEAKDIHAAIKAAIAVLDRCGLGPRTTVALEEVTARPEPPAWMFWATSAELRQVRAIAETAEARRDAGEPPLHPITDSKGDR
jgi:hypothetical protein